MDGRRTFELNLLEQVPLAMVILALDGTIGYWNKGAEALYGWSRRDIMRRPFEALGASGRAVDAVREALDAVAAGGVWAGRVALRHSRGSVLAADLRCSPLQNAEQATIGAIIVALDAGASTAADDVHVGRRIARARKEAGLTQEELAARVGVTRRSIQGWEAGSIAPYRHLDRLAAALGRRREWLVAEQPTDDLPHGMPAELKAELRNLIREELAAGARAERARPIPG